MMIGVISKRKERKIVNEFFQLFKTPWQYYNKEKSYDVVITTQEEVPGIKANLLLIYSSEIRQFDNSENVKSKSCYREVLDYDNQIKIPIYGNVLIFKDRDRAILRSNEMETAGYTTKRNNQKIVRIGYDLFQEVMFLLFEGQPCKNSLIPTLDLHISLLRELIIQEKIILLEIPPIPSGYHFISCLTHDVDFIGIRYHLFDKSMLGFIYRAIIVSLVDLLTKKISLSKYLENFKAVILLPFVYFGLYKDIWDQFDRYMEIEKDTPSTYYFLPFKNRSGRPVADKNGALRAAKYDLSDIEETIKKLQNHNFEIGVHGIDAWHNIDSAKQEIGRIRHITANDSIGIRMHWLYFKKESFQILEEAGCNYDSTAGYNETIGYLNGTGQVFRPIGVKQLMELPLHIQDVSLFSSKRMNLSDKKAFDLCKNLLKRAILHGGVMTTLWHQRSIGPERLYGEFYRCLIKEFKNNKAWFGTAIQIVGWFKKRRNILFESVEYKGKKLRVKLRNNTNNLTPSLMLRIHNTNKLMVGSAYKASKKEYIDIPLGNKNEVLISI